MTEVALLGEAHRQSEAGWRSGLQTQSNELVLISARHNAQLEREVGERVDAVSEVAVSLAELVEYSGATHTLIASAVDSAATRAAVREVGIHEALSLLAVSNSKAVQALGRDFRVFGKTQTTVLAAARAAASSELEELRLEVVAEIVSARLVAATAENGLAQQLESDILATRSHCNENLATQVCRGCKMARRGFSTRPTSPTVCFSLAGLRAAYAVERPHA